MTSRIIVHESPAIPVHKQRIEIVERKGKGHPDTICDAIAERISVELSQAYQQAFGRVLHHNIDKCLLVAGQVDCHLGGGRVKEPMRLVIGDRAAMGLDRKTLPVAEMATEAAQNWFRLNLPHVDPEKHVRYQVELKPVSPELGAIFECDRGPLPANDTSAAVGYAPLTPTERLVLDIERHLNGSLFKTEFPETGEDVKVMAVRLDQELSLTVAMPFLAKAIHSEKAYFRLRTKILKELESYVNDQPHGCKQIQVVLNALDRRNKGIKGMYLTLLGTSAEHGDSGQVGRGNRACGVIALNRPMSGEAAAGKNPVSHVGKIYNILAHELASRLTDQLRSLEEVTVWLNSTIGQRIDQPMVTVVQAALKKGIPLKRVQGDIQTIVQDGLDDMRTFCESVAKGEYSVY